LPVWQLSQVWLWRRMRMRRTVTLILSAVVQRIDTDCLA